MLQSTIRDHFVRSALTVIAVALLLVATALQSANAQQAARLRVAVDAAPRAVQPPRPTSFRPMPVAADSGEHANPVAHGAKVGALVGVAAGLAYTLLLNTKKSCTEKTNLVCNEDEHDFRTFTYPLYGGVIGAVVGGVIGSARR